jgi:hypothetical protein
MRHAALAGCVAATLSAVIRDSSRSASPETLIFHGAKREQDAIRPVRRVLLVQWAFGHKPHDSVC